MHNFTSQAARRLAPVAALAAITLCVAGPARADAATANQQETAAPLSVLTLTAGPAGVMTNVAAGQTATGTNTLAVTSTGTWALTVLDAATSNPGHMAAATPGTGGCSSSEASFVNPLTVSVAAVASGTTGTLTPTAPVSISAASQKIADGAGNVAMTDTYNNVIGSSEVLRTTCTYSLTATYTAQ